MFLRHRGYSAIIRTSCTHRVLCADNRQNTQCGYTPVLRRHIFDKAPVGSDLASSLFCKNRLQNGSKSSKLFGLRTVRLKAKSLGSYTMPSGLSPIFELRMIFKAVWRSQMQDASLVALASQRLVVTIVKIVEIIRISKLALILSFPKTNARLFHYNRPEAGQPRLSEPNNQVEIVSFACKNHSKVSLRLLTVRSVSLQSVCQDEK